MDTALEVIKWVVLILLAGFIGQFGKSLSLRVLHYFQEKKKGKASAAPAAIQALMQESKPAVPPGSDPKAEKKMLKGQLKARKKMEKSKSKDALKQT